MIFFPVVNEACRCLAEGVVVRARAIWTPPPSLEWVFRRFAAASCTGRIRIGAKRVVARLREWSTRYGGIYNPCPYLEDCAVQGRTLAEGPLKGPDRSKL